MLDQAEHLQNCLCGGRTLGCRSGFAARQPGEHFFYARIGFRGGVIAAPVSVAILNDQIVQLFAGKIRTDFFETNIEVIADKAAQIFEFEWRGDVRRQNLLDRTANISGRIQQSSIDVENINRKFRD
jgi:hypothetical protein